MLDLIETINYTTKSFGNRVVPILWGGLEKGITYAPDTAFISSLPTSWV